MFRECKVNGKGRKSTILIVNVIKNIKKCPILFLIPIIMCIFAVMIALLLYTSQQSMLVTVLIWMVIGLLLLGGVVSIFAQRSAGKNLKSELEQLDKVRQHHIEYEFVLKAMHLSTWHINAKEKILTFDNDYRSGTDNYTPEPNVPIDALGPLIGDADRPRFLKNLYDICEGRIDELHDIYSVKIPRTSKVYWEESYATVAERDVEGLPLTIVGTSTRIDERKNMEDALVTARNKAEESDRLKSAFIANMSHEIRTPLNAIIGFTSVLPDIDCKEERQELINLIQENNQKLLRIINDVMNISKIEAGKEPLVMTAFDLNIILQGTADQFSTQLANGVEMKLQMPESEMNITTDLKRVQEVLTHLVSNAVKFTSEGSVTLGYDKPENKHIRIWVADTGKGIAADDQQKVFERFYKVDEFIPGAGLGLSICETMVSSMNGDIGVDSQLGKGSTFWFEIPL